MNNREIMFRVWMPAARYMLYPETNASLEIAIVEDIYEFSQYTGLHDANDDPIYEGDVLCEVVETPRFIDSKWWSTHIEGPWVVLWWIRRACFAQCELDPVRFAHQTTADYAEHAKKIIFEGTATRDLVICGNIYESDLALMPKRMRKRDNEDRL